MEVTSSTFPDEHHLIFNASINEVSLMPNIPNAIALDTSNESAGQNLGDSRSYLHSTSIPRTSFDITINSVADIKGYGIAMKKPKRLPVTK